MVRTSDYRAYFEAMKVLDARITIVKPVIKEDHLAGIIKKIKSTDIILTCVIPSADTNALDGDNYGDLNSGLIYILKKADRTGDIDSKVWERIDLLQEIMEGVKNKMLFDNANCEDYPNMMSLLELNSLHTDPEYDFLGCDGWSLSFNFKTNEF